MSNFTTKYDDYIAKDSPMTKELKAEIDRARDEIARKYVPLEEYPNTLWRKQGFNAGFDSFHLHPCVKLMAEALGARNHCDCTENQRLAGHKKTCDEPLFKKALAAFEAAREGQK